MFGQSQPKNPAAGQASPSPSVTASSSGDAIDTGTPATTDAAEEPAAETTTIEPEALDPEPATAVTPEPEPVPVAEPTPEATAPADEAVSVYKQATQAVFTAFAQAFERFAFTATSTVVDEPEPVSVPTSEPVTEPVVDSVPEVTEESVLTTETSAPVLDTELPVTPIPEPVVKAAATTTAPVVSESTTTAADVVPETNTVVEPMGTSTTTILESAEATPPPDDDRERFVMNFSDFSIPKLQPGEFITGVQLRASLAARYADVATSARPYFEFTYITPSSTQNVGRIDFSEETSNALNGGYFLFALPQIQSEEELDDVSIEVAFVGNREDIESVMFDALWLEVDTEKVTRADLEARTKREIMEHLRQPSVDEFVSDRLDFMRTEAPVFNLRYVSQRSAVVRSIRSALGYNKVRVSEVQLLHGGIEATGIKPQVNVTTDGLISFNFPDEEMKKLRPGKYTVEFVVDEGGYTFTDSFDFQWGMLALNPDQTEYEVGEQATLTMAALSPNGNTECVANLRLYVIDPEGFINRVPVDPSGECQGNNVTDIPDYSSVVNTTVPGTYEMYLERLDEAGTVPCVG